MKILYSVLKIQFKQNKIPKQSDVVVDFDLSESRAIIVANCLNSSRAINEVFKIEETIPSHRVKTKINLVFEEFYNKEIGR
ncbi:MAG: hypothetical protein ABIP51_15045 [Bacteroidia bacterium]